MIFNASICPAPSQLPAGTATGPSRPGRLRQVWSIVWRTGLFFLLWGSLAAPYFLLSAGPLKPWLQAHAFSARLLPDVAVLLSLLAASGLMLRFIERRAFRILGLTTHTAGRDFSCGLLLGLLWLAVSLGLAWSAGWISVQSTPAMPWTNLAQSALPVLLNVVCQQLLLCGCVFQLIRFRAGLGAALIASAALFSVYHAGAFHGAWLPALNVALAGLAFGLARSTAPSLWFPIGIHAAWNTLLGPVLGLAVSGRTSLGGSWQPLHLSGPSIITGGRFGFEGSPIVTVTTGLLAAARAWKLLRATRHRPPSHSTRANATISSCSR